MKRNYLRITVLLLLGTAGMNTTNAQSPITGPSFTATQYKKALWMTTRMYGGQRAGDKNTNNGNWLLFGHPEAPDGRTFLNDADGSYDLSGGWFDCGDHVKFGHTEFWSAYLLLKGFAEFAGGYDDRYAADYQGYRNANNYTFEGNGHAPNNIPDILDEVKHATDYLIKCTRDGSTFYYQAGEGGLDHKQWVTSAKMQNNPVSEGGGPRTVFKNPNDGAMPSLAGAALALMSRLYRPYDAAYADKCLTHAKYAYSYAKPRKTQTAGAPGGFYGVNSNPQNAYAILLTELYWATQDEAYKTEAMDMTVSASASTTHVRGNPFGLDYANNGDMAVYNLFLLGRSDAEEAFNTIVTTHYLGNVQNDGQFRGGNTNWGPLRYNASAAFVVALWAKRNSVTDDAKKFIYSNIDYILGKNSRNYSFVVGFASNGATHPHHRNVFMSDANNNSNLTIPAKNQQFGYMVGGKRDPNAYQDVTDSYQHTEGGIDYTSGLVGALAWINLQVAPVNKFSVDDVVLNVVSAEEAAGLVVYPNPSSASFSVNSPIDATVIVFDEMGREVSRFNTAYRKEFGADLTQGLYHVSFYKGNELVKTINVIKN